jgi:hypothetical protein
MIFVRRHSIIYAKAPPFSSQWKMCCWQVAKDSVTYTLEPLRKYSSLIYMIQKCSPGFGPWLVSCRHANEHVSACSGSQNNSSEKPVSSIVLPFGQSFQSWIVAAHIKTSHVLLRTQLFRNIWFKVLELKLFWSMLQTHFLHRWYLKGVQSTFSLVLYMLTINNNNNNIAYVHGGLDFRTQAQWLLYTYKL